MTLVGGGGRCSSVPCGSGAGSLLATSGKGLYLCPCHLQRGDSTGGEDSMRLPESRPGRVPASEARCLSPRPVRRPWEGRGAPAGPRGARPAAPPLTGPLCPQIQHTEDMENEIDELLQEFEEKSGRAFLHTVCFY